MRLRMKWIIGIIGNIIYGSKINKHPTTTIFQCAWFTHRHSSVILGSFQGVIVIRLPRNFVYLSCTLYLLMINDLNTTSLVYLWSVGYGQSIILIWMNCLWCIYLCESYCKMQHHNETQSPSSSKQQKPPQIYQKSMVV